MDPSITEHACEARFMRKEAQDIDSYHPTIINQFLALRLPSCPLAYSQKSDNNPITLRTINTRIRCDGAGRLPRNRCWPIFPVVGGKLLINSCSHAVWVFRVHFLEHLGDTSILDHIASSREFEASNVPSWSSSY